MEQIIRGFFKCTFEAAGRRPGPQLLSAVTAALWVSHVEGFVCDWLQQDSLNVSLHVTEHNSISQLTGN